MPISDKIMNWAQARKYCDELRSQGKKIVFTNGCFDILHKGHVQYLEQAGALGDALIVGLNSDDSTRVLKGPGRPINRQDSRAFVLASMGFVDAVVVFDEETPYELIRSLTPDILVKGGDYKESEVVGGDHVKKNGGMVVILGYLDGFSTTAIESKIRDLSNE
jgi:rfaE bifunctional protein nucleotidyltransferase chain/domain